MPPVSESPVTDSDARLNANEDGASREGEGAEGDGAEGNVAEYLGPYQFPDIRRRRVPGAMYLVAGVAMIGLYLARGDGGVLVSRGFLVGGLALVVIGVYHQVAGWHLAVDQTDALAAASRQVGFAVGHASAQLGWRGLLSRPTWRILLYSAETPPRRRGLVLIDAVDASVVGDMVHDNPEDWSVYGE